MRAAGIVLAGGRSERMGTSKAWLEWHGSTLLEHVVGIVGDAIDGGPLVVVAAVGQELPRLPERVIVVTDDREGLGPLQGIVERARSAARAGRSRLRLVDRRRAPPPCVRAARPLGTRRRISTPSYRTPAATGSRSPPPTASISPTSSTRCSRRVSSSPPSSSSAAGRASSTIAWLLADPALAAADPTLASLENLNDPEAYRAARALP